MIKESILNIKPSVIIKPKDGRRAYIRDDPRLTEALRSLKHIKRAQEPHDANINPRFTAWVKKSEDEIKLIQIDSENEAEIDNEPSDTLSKKVALSNFLVRPGLLGNDSGAEDEFQADGTQLLVKEEVRSEDSEAEGGYCHPDDRIPKNNQHQQKPETCSTSTQIEPADVADSDSSSEDENPPNVETVNTARKLVVFNINQQLMDDAGTSTALLQALAKFRFKFNTPEGVTKTCGEDFLNIDIPKDARVKSAKTKRKGTGKKSNPGHNSAQERDQDILVLEISNEESEMLGEPTAKNEKNSAGPSQIEKEDRDRKEEKGKRKEQEEAPKRSDENKTPKRKNSQKYQWINFYHEESSRAFKEAKEFRASHQLLVHGLPKTLVAPTKAGTQERVLNDLMAGLSQETLGEDGIDLVQENIIGAYPIEPTPRDRSPVTRITLDSRETKASIRKAAERAGRWGNGTHSVFFRDITLEKRRRKSSDEDTNTPKRGKLEDTPKRGKEQKMSRLAQIGAQIRRESWSEERPREERARTVWQRQKERDD